jgi:hypothetical protein
MVWVANAGTRGAILSREANPIAMVLGVFLANRSPGQSPDQWIYLGHRNRTDAGQFMSLYRFGFIAFGNSRGAE